MNSKLAPEEITKIMRAFDFCHLYGEIVRKSQMDGLIAWRKLVGMLELYDIKTTFEVTDKVRHLVEKHLCLPPNGETDENDAEFAIEIEVQGKPTVIKNDVKNNLPHHFMVQLLRLVCKGNFNLSFVKACQVFYNMGQIEGTLFTESGSYPEGFVEFYRENGLDKIETYFKFQETSKL